MTKLLNIKSQREKGEITFEISTINFTGDFSTGTMEARRTKITFQSIWIECSYLQEHGFVNKKKNHVAWKNPNTKKEILYCFHVERMQKWKKLIYNGRSGHSVCFYCCCLGKVLSLL